ncbi:hypothetical protein GQX73_g9230 [Xylaria multiplex]|uniref:NACHT domain-containing protein n=1 Tax=Xylaria multiplex TaxID=323545 RepID=A0A7C8MGZ5_9PEZI|nr:hypothetical protein GQX73_g9230 [Xylaria multiplex]
MLPAIVPSARIFTCDWPSDLFEHSDYSQKTLEDFAELILEGIETRPSAANSIKHKERPILFIASCLGGILLMKALVMAPHKYSSIQKAARGIVFLATPFGGTSFIDVAKLAEPGLKALAFFRDKKVSNLIDETKLKPGLKRLCGDFTSLYRHIDPSCMATFHETGKTSLPRKLVPWLPARWARLTPLVDEISGSLDSIHHRLPLNRTHLLMNKFPLPPDDDYNLVAGRIHEIFETIRKGQPVERADAYIMNTCYDAEKLRIERISGDLLPMERCYVNLVIIEDLAKKHKGKQEGTPRSWQFSLNDRLKIETRDENREVNMWHLFDQRKGDNMSIVQPKRILIRGHAGVGKSTLCKKIVHDFKELGMWRNMFARILWVPLRNLKELTGEKCNLKGMLFQEYFSQTPRGEEFAYELSIKLERDNYKETLFILDGLDEVYEDLNRDSSMFSFLEILLNLPAVIVTSRPYVSPPHLSDLMFDLELETIGFYPDQVESYMENALIIPENIELSRQKIDGLWSLLQQHQLLQGLARIPIQLDALCYICSNDEKSLHAGSRLNTMTDIYQAIVTSLWRKDIPILRRKYRGEIIKPANIRDATLKILEHYVSSELDFLEILAFTGIINNIISFETSRCIDILGDRNPPILPAKTLPHLSFLRTSNASSRQPTYHFLHLTFQEYFAARYFVRQWKAKEPLLLGKDKLSIDVKTFLAHHKYDPRYNIFWRFVTGLLSLENNIVEFFRLIESEPRDLLGPPHERLVIHCLNEVPLDGAISSIEREKLKYQLGRWAVFEYKLTKRSTLVNEMEFPEALLENIPQSASIDDRLILFKSIKFRSTIPSRVIYLVCSWLRDNDKALGAIVACLEHEEIDVQIAVIETLETWSQLRGGGLNAVATQDIDKERPIRLAAVSDRSRLDDKVINALIAQLGRRSQPPQIPWPHCLKSGGARRHDLGLSLRCKVQGRSYEEQWRHEEEQRRDKAIIRIFAPQLKSREEFLDVILTRLKNKHDAGNTAAQLHKHQPDLCDNVFRTIAALFVGGNKVIQRAVIKQLGQWPKPNDKVLEIFVAQLQDQSRDVQIAAIAQLGQWPKPNDKILEIFIAQLKNQDPFVREAVINQLGQWPKLDNTILEIFIAQLKNQDPVVQKAVIDQLGEWPRLDNTILEILKAQLKDQDSSVRQAVINQLKRWPKLDNTILEILKAQLEDQDPFVRKAIIDQLGQWPKRDNMILDIFMSQLKDQDSSIRGAIIEHLRQWPEPNSRILNIVVTHLTDKKDWVRWAAIGALEYQPQLGHNTLKAIEERAQDENERSFIRKRAVETIMNRRELGDRIHNMIPRWFRDKDAAVRECVLLVLRGWRRPRARIVDAVVALLKEDDLNIQMAALQVLGSWSQLSDTILNNISKQLESHREDVREAAARVFQKQPRPNDNIIKDIVAQLDTPRPRLQMELLLALARWAPLDDYVLYAVAELLPQITMGSDSNTRAAAMVLQAQPQPKDDIINAIKKHLENPRSGVRKVALAALRSWSRLSDQSLVTIASHLGDNFVKEEAFAVLINQDSLPFAALKPHMELLYRFFLERSFEEHIYWHIENGQSFILVGARRIDWKMAEDDIVGKSKSESNTGNENALWLRRCAPTWRKKLGFTGTEQSISFMITDGCDQVTPLAT